MNAGRTPVPSTSARFGPRHSPDGHRSSPRGDTGEGVVLHTRVGLVNAILHLSADGGERAIFWVWGARRLYRACRGSRSPTAGMTATHDVRCSAPGIGVPRPW